MSLFQKLPWDVAYAVVCHVARGEPKALQHASRLGRECHMLPPLLETSQVWRSAALAHLCYTCEIGFGSAQRQQFARFAEWPSGMDSPLGYANHHVRRVNVQADLLAVLSGAAASMLRGEELRSVRFPHASAVDISASFGGTVSKAQLKDAENRIAEFCDLLWALLPAAANVCISTRSTARSGPSQRNGLEGFFFRQLRGRATSLRLDMDTPLLLQSVPAEHLANLTSLRASIVYDHEPVSRVLLLNSQWLQELDVTFTTKEAARAVAYCGEASISYPRLSKLVLALPNQHFAPSVSLTTAGSVFPALRHLHLTCGFPFSDDTLFRESHATLEYLHFTSDRYALGVLDGYLKSTGAHFSSLRRLSIEHPWLEHRHDTTTTSSAMALMSRVVPSLLSLSLAMSGPELHPAELIAWIGMFPKQLRVLTIKDQCIGIFDIIALLKELPLLESLKCRFDESSMEQEDFASQLGELQAASVPLNTSFKRWIPFKNGWELRGRFDQCAEILAGLCPNFSYGETGQTSGAPASAQRASSELEDGEFSIYSLL